MLIFFYLKLRNIVGHRSRVTLGCRNEFSRRRNHTGKLCWGGTGRIGFLVSG